MPSRQNSISIGFAATQIEARRAIVLTMAQLPDLGISQSRCSDIEIALAEVVNNVVEHAFDGLPDATGHITCLIEADTLTIEVSDTGRPIPDNQLPTGSRADLSGPMADLPEGGFGWFLIRQIATTVTYERTNGQNRLILEFRSEGKGEMP
ncbi:MAG: serine/threonine-protein kinase RsbW [Paracoccaceae bacterium]